MHLLIDDLFLCNHFNLKAVSVQTQSSNNSVTYTTPIIAVPWVVIRVGTAPHEDSFLTA